jgi:GNAT superfamily N-acetyltransferase
MPRGGYCTRDHIASAAPVLRRRPDCYTRRVHDVAPLDDYPKTLVLTDGTHVTLRPGTADDRGRMEALRARIGASEAFHARPGSVVILAIDDDRAVGALTLDRDDGTLRVALAPDYRGRRLGTWMLLDAVHLATDLGMSRLVARVAAEEHELRAALDRLDFQSEMVGGDGVSVLGKTLHRGWPNF